MAGGWREIGGRAEKPPVGVDPVLGHHPLGLAYVERTGAHQVAQLPFETILGLCAPFGLDGSPQLRPEIRLYFRPADSQRTR
jgi:hypothetical protein